MSEVATYKQIRAYDPTRTTTLRNYFARDVKRRFAELISVINKSVAINDCFGLRKISVFQMTPASQNSMKQRDNSEKLALFLLWLQSQVDNGIISANTSWTDPYILEAYRRGVARSRYEMKKAGYDVPTLEETGGIDMAMRNPNHREMLLLLYARMVGNMKGLTDAMKVSILNILAQGLAANDSPEELVKKLSAIIPLARAATIARDAVIMAFAEGQLTEFESWGVTQVGIEAEVIWQTIGDEKVCTRCHAMEGKVFTISEARGKIPLHSHCRCSWVLVNKS